MRSSISFPTSSTVELMMRLRTMFRMGTGILASTSSEIVAGMVRSIRVRGIRVEA